MAAAGTSKSACTTCSTRKRASNLNTADVVIVLFKYHPHGGSQKDAVRLARALNARGVVAHIYVNEIEGEAPEDVRVVALNQTGLQNYSKNDAFVSRLSQLLKDGLARYVVSFVRTTLADHFVAADPCFKNRVRNKRPLWLAELNPRDRAFLAAEQATLCTGKRRFSFLTQTQFEDYASAYPLHDLPHQILPLEVRSDCKKGADSARKRRDARDALNIGDGTLLLLAVGSGFRTKGLDRSILALHRLAETGRKAQLVVVGRDDERAFVRLARRLNVHDSVRFLGGRDDVGDLYAAADLLLHPARAEAGGKVLLEAMASGLAVITTDVCGYAAACKEAGGAIVLPSPFDQSVFNGQVRLLAEPAAREALAQNGAVYARDIGDNDMIDALADEVQRGLSSVTHQHT